MMTCEPEMPLYPYRCLMRPPTPGAVPRVGLVECDFKEGTTPGGHHFWGTVVYNRKLDDQAIQHYDLEPTCFGVAGKDRCDAL